MPLQPPPKTPNRYVKDRKKLPNSINGKSCNLNNCLKNVIYKAYLPAAADGAAAADADAAGAAEAGKAGKAGAGGNYAASIPPQEVIVVFGERPPEIEREREGESKGAGGSGRPCFLILFFFGGSGSRRPARDRPRKKKAPPKPLTLSNADKQPPPPPFSQYRRRHGRQAQLLPARARGHVGRLCGLVPHPARVQQRRAQRRHLQQHQPAVLAVRPARVRRLGLRRVHRDQLLHPRARPGESGVVPGVHDHGGLRAFDGAQDGRGEGEVPVGVLGRGGGARRGAQRYQAEVEVDQGERERESEREGAREGLVFFGGGGGQRAPDGRKEGR
jgi:hypothetical protein